MGHSHAPKANLAGLSDFDGRAEAVSARVVPRLASGALMPIEKNNSLAAARLRELLTYHPDCGLFTWNLARGSRCKGCLAGNMNSSGAIQIQIDRQVYVAHRLAWLYVYGVFPDDEIDHENGVPADNRWTNLRPATHMQNCWNRKKSIANTSGFTGACWISAKEKWVAAIRAGGNKILIGYFDTPEEAGSAYAAKAKELFGEFWRAA